MAASRQFLNGAFDDVFRVLLEDFKVLYKDHKELNKAVSWFQRVCEYNVPHGKKNRGLTVVTAYKQLTTKNKHTHDNLHKARVLGWCIEFLQGFFLVADDIMDHSLTRRGQPCWYKQKDVDMIAINDSFFMDSIIYQFLKLYFKQDDCYVDLMELFHEVTLHTVMGQCLDLQAATTPGDFTHYTLDNYMAIIKWKTAYYSFYLPVALAMHMTGISDPQAHSNAKVILIHMGCYFQIQDDYLDCYGSVALTGKVGTDIQDNKCCWLVVQALQLADSDQRKILEENYGVDCPDKITRVKQVYDDLGLTQIYRDFEEDSYQELMKLIVSNNGGLPEELFVAFADRIYKRTS